MLRENGVFIGRFKVRQLMRAVAIGVVGKTQFAN
jgi:hypothetical protein